MQSEAVEGKEFTIEICIKNIGNDFSKSCNSSIYISIDNDNEVLNDYPVCNKLVQSLSINEEIWISHSFFFPDLLNNPSGQYPIWIVCVIDSSNEINEKDENNRWKNTSQIIVFDKQDKQPTQPGIGVSRNNPIPFKQYYLTSEGFQISATGFVGGTAAWNILYQANRFNNPPSYGMQYVLISLSVKNVSSKDDPSRISSLDFSLVGSSNKIFRSFDKAIVQPSEGIYKELEGEIYQNGQIVGSLAFYIPSNETNIQLIWDYFKDFEDNKRYFAIDSTSSQPPNPPSNNDWQIQYSFPNRYSLYNLKDVYIKEDNNNYYFKFTSYDLWKYSTDLSLSLWIDKDQNIYTGTKTDDGIPMGDDILITFLYNDDKKYIGGIGEWDDYNSKFSVSYIFSSDEYELESFSLTFSVPKKFFIQNHAFDYAFMLFSKGKNFETEAYPNPIDKLTYPKNTNNKTVKPKGLKLIDFSQRTTYLQKFNKNLLSLEIK